MLQETEETIGFVVIIFIIGGHSDEGGGPWPPLAASMQGEEAKCPN